MINTSQIVSISEFRSDLSSWLDSASGQNPVLVIQNSKPKVMVVDPQYLEYLEKYADGYYDAGDSSEADKVIDSNEFKKSLRFDPKKY